VNRYSRLKIVAVGQLPPPLNGLTLITSRLLSSLAGAGYDVTVVNTAGRIGRRSIAFHLSRSMRVGRALCSMAWTSFCRSERVCYLTADGGLGLLYSVVVAGFARFLRFRIYIHHHSFSYIVRQRMLMRLLLAWSGSNAVHICLCHTMAQDLSRRYRRPIRALILSNAAFVESGPLVTKLSSREHLVIGLLSNLTSEKGLYEFLAIIRAAKQRGLAIRGVLGGPIILDKDKVLVDSTREDVGEYLDYRGPIYGEEKSRFFGDIDVFIFLTTYLNEAQPTVLFEAMAYGKPVITYDRGCIATQVASSGAVLSQGADFISETLKLLMEYCNGTDALAKQEQAAVLQFEDERRQGQNLVAKLFDSDPVRVDFH
jgi:glycosyltransferase involved in cell wall biosynthesis